MDQPGKPEPIVQQSGMMIHQVLCEGAQGAQALVRDALRPEDHPREIAEPQGGGQGGQGPDPAEIGCARPAQPREPVPQDSENKFLKEKIRRFIYLFFLFNF